MKCTQVECGAMSCYLCGVEVQDYSHFCNKVACPCGKCELWTSTEKMELQDRKARQEAGRKELTQLGWNHSDILQALASPPEKKSNRAVRETTAVDDRARLRNGEGAEVDLQEVREPAQHDRVHLQQQAQIRQERIFANMHQDFAQLGLQLYRVQRHRAHNPVRTVAHQNQRMRDQRQRNVEREQRQRELQGAAEQRQRVAEQLLRERQRAAQQRQTDAERRQRAAQQRRRNVAQRQQFTQLQAADQHQLLHNLAAEQRKRAAEQLQQLHRQAADLRHYATEQRDAEPIERAVLQRQRAIEQAMREAMW